MLGDVAGTDYDAPVNLERRHLSRGDVPATAVGPGFLATTSANNWGPGKIVAIDDSEATIEYFDSIGQSEPTRVSVPKASVRRFRAKPQTRCYWEVGGQWRIGRVVGMRDEVYAVRSSNAPDGEVPESDLHVRWHRRLADPTEVLMVRAHESPYFHNCRQPFVASLVRQRAACSGLTGLLSSVVQFYEHQVEIARRVLTDPVQRYLLADEVGLGKTIEAGLVIRQFLLDEPTAYVLILAPEPLRVQWVKEMREKFLVDDFSRATIKVLGHDDSAKWGRHEGDSNNSNIWPLVPQECSC
jgi:ATP-dependent helicase HepA